MRNLQPEAPAAVPAPGPLRLWSILALVLVLAFAAYLRVQAALGTELPNPVQGDSERYVSAAFNLREFGVLSPASTWRDPVPSRPAPGALVLPGYPAMLAPLLEGVPDFAFWRRVALLQAGLGLVAVGLGYLLARRLLPNWAALVVAALLAMAPQLVTLGTALLGETLFTLATLVFALTLAKAAYGQRLAWYGAAGVALGACALVRPTLLYLPVLLLPAIAWLATRARWQACAVLMLGFALSFGPWLVRNQLATGAASDSTLMTNTLLHGSYPDLMYAGRPETFGFPYSFDPRASSVRTPRQALGRIRENFSADPLGTLRWYLVGKPIRFHDWSFAEGQGDVYINTTTRSPYFSNPTFIASHHLMHWLHAPLMVLGVAGMLCALSGVVRRNREPRARVAGLLAVTLLFAIALHMIGLPLARYAIPFRPLTYLFALEALLALHGAMQRRWP